MSKRQCTTCGRYYPRFSSVCDCYGWSEVVAQSGSPVSLPTYEILKPCPFCGGEGLPRSVTCTNGIINYFIGCRCCASEGGWRKTEAGAVREWNMRAVVDSTDTAAIKADNG